VEYSQALIRVSLLGWSGMVLGEVMELIGIISYLNFGINSIDISPKSIYCSYNSLKYYCKCHKK